MLKAIGQSVEYVSGAVKSFLNVESVLTSDHNILHLQVYLEKRHPHLLIKIGIIKNGLPDSQLNLTRK
jgi:hypothetical protein